MASPSDLVMEMTPEITEDDQIPADRVKQSERNMKPSLETSNPSDSFTHHVGDRVCNVEMVPTRKRKIHNVLTRMQDEKLRGPLGVLQHCMNNNIRVKVLTRNFKHVRGICIGYILAFDKHWNLALKDVDEIYKNPLLKPNEKRVKRAKPAAEETGSSNATLHHHDVSESSTKNIKRPAKNVYHSMSEDDLYNDIEVISQFSTSVNCLKQQKQCVRDGVQELGLSLDKQQSQVEELGPSDVAFTEEISRLVPESPKDSYGKSVERLQSGEVKNIKTHKSQTESNREGRSRLRNQHSSIDNSFKDVDVEREKKKMSKEFTNLSQRKTSDHKRHETNRSLSRQLNSDKLSHHVSSSTELQSQPTQKNSKISDMQTDYQPWLARHVNQLFIRGDNVVLVSTHDI